MRIETADREQGRRGFVAGLIAAVRWLVLRPLLLRVNRAEDCCKSGVLCCGVDSPRAAG